MAGRNHAALLLFLLLATAAFAARDLEAGLKSTSKPAKPTGGKPPGGGGVGGGIPGVGGGDPTGTGFFGPGNGGFNIPGMGGGWGAGYGGPAGGYAHGGVVAPTVVCSEKGPCYKKKVTCPKKCFSSYSHAGKGYGGGGGGGGCTVDCKTKCTAYC